MASKDVVNEASSSATLKIVLLLDYLFEAERIARERLVLGCAEDIVTLGELAKAFVTSTRSTTQSQEIALSFVDNVTGRASLLARARLKSYANALVAAECPLARQLATSFPALADWRLPRIFPVRVAIRFAPPPESDIRADNWSQNLSNYAVEQTAIRVAATRERILSYGQDRLHMIRLRLLSAGLIE